MSISIYNPRISCQSDGQKVYTYKGKYYSKDIDVHNGGANPSKYVPNWNTIRPGHQQSLIKGWLKEITNGAEQIKILRGILGN